MLIEMKNQKMLCKIKTEELHVESSRFLFPPAFLRNEDKEKVNLKALHASLDALPFLSHPVVYRSEGHGFHLVHGLRRVRWLVKKGEEEISAVVLDNGTSVKDLGTCILAIKSHAVMESAVSRACFCAFLKEIGIKEEDIITLFLPLLEMNSHKKIFSRCMRIASMPEEALTFCHQKRFSFKKCMNIARHEKGLLEKVFALKSCLSLSASVLEEILSTLLDISRMYEKSYDKILDSKGVRAIFHGDLSPSERTAAFRQLLREMRYPVLTEVNRKITSEIKAMEFPANLGISYDHTLENRNITISLSVKDEKTLKDGVRAISREKTLKGVMKILREL